MQGLRSINSPECGFDGPAQIIDANTFLSDQHGTSYVSVVVKLGSMVDWDSLQHRPLVQDRVMYAIHVLLNPGLDLRPRIFSYEFQFRTRFTSQDWILKTFLGMVQEGDQVSHELRQTYTVSRLNRLCRDKVFKTVLGTGMVCPHELGICELEDAHRSFVGLWDHNLDIDRPASFHPNRSLELESYSENDFEQPVIVLQIPMSLIRGMQHIDGIYATKISLNPRRSLLHKTSPVVLSRKHR